MFVTLGIKLNKGNFHGMGELGCSSIFGVKVAFTKWMNMNPRSRAASTFPNWSRGAPGRLKSRGSFGQVLPGSPQWYP
jgi:hypothetical protein